MLAGARCTTQQRNTHSTESREVRYPWHPWFGRMITVYATLTKGGHPLCRCGLDDQHHERSLGVSPSNRCHGYTTSCCAPTMCLTALWAMAARMSDAPPK